MLKRYWKVCTFLLVTFGVVLWIIGISQSFEHCIDQRNKAEAENSPNQSPSVISVFVVRRDINIACAGHFTEQNHGAITALATLLIAIFTATLWLTTRAQISHLEKSLDLAKDQLVLARNEFVSTHRPRLRVRNVALTHPMPVGNRPGINLIEANFPIIGTLEIVNRGETQARIVESHCEAAWTKDGGLPERTSLDPANGFAGRVALEPAIPQTFKFTSRSAMGQDAGEYRLFPSEGYRIFVIGWVRYADGAGIARQIAFCRHYGIAHGERFPRFQKVADSDYEYED